MKIVTGHQPVYLPWLGLFHKICLGDVFVFMDDVQYLKKDWNNRNKIKGPQGEFWLSVPVKLKASASSDLKDIIVDYESWENKDHWQKAHWKSIQSCYGKTPFWEDYSPWLEEFYLKKSWKWLAELNLELLKYFLKVLEIEREIIIASEYGFEGYKSDLVLDHCRKLDSNICVLGKLGKDYLVEEDFLNDGISVHYQDYQHPQYPQKFGNFISHLSVIDLLFNCGPESRNILFSGNITKEDLIQDVKNNPVPHEIVF